MNIDACDFCIGDSSRYVCRQQTCQWIIIKGNQEMRYYQCKDHQVTLLRGLSGYDLVIKLTREEALVHSVMAE